MLEYKILETKPSIKENDDEYFDLLAHNYKVPNDVYGDFLVVEKYYVARPDLISLAIYGTDQYADIICKVNGISNPFELNENDMIFLPNIEYITDCVKAVHTPCERASDNDKLNIQINTDHRKQLYEKRTANELTVNNENYIIDKTLGLVFY